MATSQQSTDDPARRLGSIEAAADYFACSPRTVRRLVEDGEITGYRVGKRLLRVDLNELDALLAPVHSAGGAE